VEWGGAAVVSDHDGQALFDRLLHCRHISCAQRERWRVHKARVHEARVHEARIHQAFCRISISIHVPQSVHVTMTVAVCVCAQTFKGPSGQRDAEPRSALHVYNREQAHACDREPTGANGGVHTSAHNRHVLSARRAAKAGAIACRLKG